MKRSDVLNLRTSVWVPVDETDLELELVPSSANLIQDMILGLGDKKLEKKLCTKAFINFRNYVEDDGTVILNTLANRVELLSVLAVRRAIIDQLAELNERAVEGEVDAVAGS